MKAPSPWLRPLQLVAVALAVAIAVLAMLLLQRDPAPPAAPTAPSTNATSVAVAPASAHEAASERDPTTPATDAPATRTTTGGPPTAMLYGTLRAADGAPIDRAMLWLRNGASGSNSSGRFEAGAFVFAGLQPGSYELTTRVQDQLPLQRTIEVVAPRTRLDLQLDARWLLTVNAVTVDGEPLQAAAKLGPMFRGLTANAFAEPLAGDLPPSAMSSVAVGIGTFRGNDFMQRGAALPKQAIGVLTLPAGEPVHVALLLRNTVVAQQLVPAGQDEVTFTLPVDAVTGKLASVRLRCIDGAGQALAGVHIGLSDRQSGSGGQATDDDGRITLSRLVPGRLRLSVRHQDLCAPGVTIDVLPGADLDLGDIALQPAIDVPVSLEGLGKQARLNWSMLDALPRADWQHGDGWYSGENGVTTSLSLFPGRYAFLVRNDDGAAITEVDLHTAPTEPLRFRIAPAGELRLTNRVGSGFARLCIATASGARIYERELTGTWTTTQRLPPGSYQVEITDQANHTTRRTLQLGAEGAELTVP